jgi:carbonic anhydrase/acetyltransferase-like protein (isoleucine patch superfamily)
VVSGLVDIGEYCFIGVNATIANNVSIGRDCLIGAGAAILRDTEPGGIYAVTPTPVRPVSTWERFGVEDRGG